MFVSVLRQHACVHEAVVQLERARERKRGRNFIKAERKRRLRHGKRLLRTLFPLAAAPNSSAPSRRRRSPPRNKRRRSPERAQEFGKGGRGKREVAAVPAPQIDPPRHSWHPSPNSRLLPRCRKRRHRRKRSVLTTSRKKQTARLRPRRPEEVRRNEEALSRAREKKWGVGERLSDHEHSCADHRRSSGSNHTHPY